MQTSDVTDKVLPALLKASGSFAAIHTDAENTHFRSKYAKLPAYLDAVNPALRENGLILTQATSIGETRTVIHTRITHAGSGQWVGSEYPVHPIKPDPQAEGSALTYARRYALAALLGLAADDDDGNSAAKNSAPAKRGTVAHPASGVMDTLTEDQRAECHKQATIVLEYMEAGDADGACQFIESKALDADRKTALWSLLPSQTRTALKKAHEAQRAAP